MTTLFSSVTMIAFVIRLTSVSMVNIVPDVTMVIMATKITVPL